VVVEKKYNKLIPKKTKIYIAGHKGMVGSAVWRILAFKGYSNSIGVTREKLDLRNRMAIFNRT